MYGLFAIKYGKSFLVQQFKTENEAKIKYDELDATKEKNVEYFIRKV